MAAGDCRHRRKLEKTSDDALATAWRAEIEFLQCPLAVGVALLKGLTLVVKSVKSTLSRAAKRFHYTWQYDTLTVTPFHTE